MQEKVLEFAQLLREGGLRVSTSEVLDCLSALDEVSFSDRAVFREALRSTLIKRTGDLSAFDRAFELYWSGFYDKLRSAFDRAENAWGEAGHDSDALLTQLIAALQELDPESFDALSDLATAILTGDVAALEDMLIASGQHSNLDQIRGALQLGHFRRQLLQGMGIEQALQEVSNMMQRLAESGVPSDTLQALHDLVGLRIAALREGALELARKSLRENKPKPLESEQQDALLDKSFYYLNPEEIQRMRDVVSRLARRIKNQFSLRRHRRKRGKLDLHRTLRRNMGRGGIPFEVIFRERRLERPKLIVLCDVSSSVANVSRFMLQFVYSLQEAFTKIRSYVFVSELGEVTPLFRGTDVSEAIESALNGGGVINVYSRSSFGLAFRSFVDEHIEVVDKRTTVLIIGDARNNYTRPEVECLRKIHERAKNLIWLNPENPRSWGFGDSVMDQYLPHCDVAEECGNLRQLSAIVDDLIL